MGEARALRQHRGGHPDRKKVVDIGFIVKRSPHGGFLTAYIHPRDYDPRWKFPLGERTAMKVAKLAFEEETLNRDILFMFEDDTVSVVFDGRKRDAPHPENVALILAKDERDAFSLP